MRAGHVESECRDVVDRGFETGCIGTKSLVSGCCDESTVMRNARAIGFLNCDETERNQKRCAASAECLNNPMARHSS